LQEKTVAAVGTANKNARKAEKPYGRFITETTSIQL
jgi:hypothetical protein